MLEFVKSFECAGHEPEDCTLLVHSQHSCSKDLSLPERALSYPEAMAYDDLNQGYQVAASRNSSRNDEAVVKLNDCGFLSLVCFLRQAAPRTNSAASS
jgi:hypothetical protein